uniref:TSC22 domain family protein 3 n=1 Tax=Ailuropoda melanoleuca TaxID=9646 RepID=A0A7N5K315_AILME
GVGRATELFQLDLQVNVVSSHLLWRTPYVVAIDNKIEQAMDLVKNHLMYAVREEVEVLKEQIKELAEKNSQLERENSLLKNLASPEQLQKFRSRLPLEALSPAATEKMSPGAAAPAQHRAGSAV